MPKNQVELQICDYCKRMALPEYYAKITIIENSKESDEVHDFCSKNHAAIWLLGGRKK